MRRRKRCEKTKRGSCSGKTPLPLLASVCTISGKNKMKCISKGLVARRICTRFRCPSSPLASSNGLQLVLRSSSSGNCRNSVAIVFSHEPAKRTVKLHRKWQHCFKKQFCSCVTNGFLYISKNVFVITRDNRGPKM